jgi:O-antigen ligase
VPSLFNFSIRAWFDWVTKLSHIKKWFIFFILLKPVIDIFTYLKEDGYYSPAQIAGVFVFGMSIWSLWEARHLITATRLNILIVIIAGMIAFNFSAQLIYTPSIKSFGNLIRALLPFSFIFYFKIFISSKEDFNGLLLTFLISSTIPMMLLFYEVLIEPISIKRIAYYRGGFVRFKGPYESMYAYMSCIISNWMIISSFYVSKVYASRHKVSQTLLKPTIILLLCAIVTIIGLIVIRHQSSWCVIVALLTIFLFMLRRLLFSLASIVKISLVAITLVTVYLLWENTIAPLFVKQINLISNWNIHDLSINGRVDRWKSFMAQWENLHVTMKLFGVGLVNSEIAYPMMSAIPHSEYLYFLSTAGVVGLFCWLFVLGYSAFISRKLKNSGISNLILCSITAICLYSLVLYPFSSPLSIMYLFSMAISIATNPRHTSDKLSF